MARLSNQTNSVVDLQEQTADNQKVENLDYSSMINKTKETPPDFHRWTSDIEPLKNAFYFRLCGWRFVTKTKKVKREVLGENIETYQELVIDYNGRVMNEAGAENYYYDLFPMLNQVVTSSKLKRTQIYKSWNAKMLTIILEINTMAYNLENNVYEIRKGRTSNIITFFCNLWNISFKAEEGFTTEHIADQITRAELIRHDIDPRKPEKPKSFLDNLNVFKQQN